MMLSKLRVVWTVFYLYLKQIAIDGFIIFTVIIQPLLVALLAIYMLRDIEGFQAIYVIVGSALTGLWSGTLFFNSFNIQGERWSGCLENIIGSPTRLQTVVLGKVLANLIISVSSMFFSYPIAVLLFKFRLTIAHPFLFSISLVMTIIALMSLGLVIAPIFSLNPGNIMWVNAFEFPMYILGGFLFPILLLPGWTTPISYILSPYWAARALHITSSGSTSLSDVLIYWGLIIFLSLIYLFVSSWLFRVLLWRAKEKATLGLQ